MDAQEHEKEEGEAELPQGESGNGSAVAEHDAGGWSDDVRR
jgi:hypothetical protein